MTLPALMLPLEYSVPISLADVREWARLLDDANPLHEAAGGAVIPGPALLAVVLSAVKRLLPGSRVITVASRFTATVAAPANITVRLWAATQRDDSSADPQWMAAVMVGEREVFKANVALAGCDSSSEEH
ncbi:MAG: hypothetical protein ACKO0U_06610 [Gammaproteobacteria bacterium]